MCVLSLPRRNGFRVIQGIDEKGVCHSPLPSRPPPAILISRSFHIQRGYNQVCLCAAVCTCRPSGLRAREQRAKTGNGRDIDPHSETLLIMATLLKGTLGT